MRFGLRCVAATVAGLIVLAAAAGPAAAGEAGAAGPFLPGPPIVRGLPPAPPADVHDALLSERLSRAEAAAGVPRESIDYFVRTFGVDEETARHRLATQAMIPNAGLVLSEELGTAYTDSWWDNDTGELVVMATRAASEATVATALAEHRLARTDFRIERTDYDQADLAGARLDASRRLSGVGEQATVGVAAGRVVVTLARGMEAAERNEIRAENERLSARADAPPVTTVVSSRRSLDPEPRINCNPANHNCDEIIAGSKFYNNTIGHCTMAYFVGWAGRSPWVPSALTAGHCINNEPLVAEQSKCRANGWSCDPIGLSLQYFYGMGRGDVGMIDVYASGWSIYGGWWNWGPGYQTPIQGLVWDPPGVGYVVCKNGATSGSSCGTVTERWVDWTSGDRLTGMIRTNVWGCGGDSGSPLTSASVQHAVGILSGGAPDPNGGNCAAIAEYYTPIWQPIHYFNLEYYTGGPFAL